MVIEYLEGWLNGRGAKGIDSLEGRPGVHPPLMEDLATGRMSVAQIAQRIIHGAADTETGETHDLALVKRLLGEELDDILSRRRAETADQAALAAAEERYRAAHKIAMRWVLNYTELDFRSLGSYTRADLAANRRSPGRLLDQGLFRGFARPTNNDASDRRSTLAASRPGAPSRGDGRGWVCECSTRTAYRGAIDECEWSSSIPS